jgi:hypothetical protein
MRARVLHISGLVLVAVAGVLALRAMGAAWAVVVALAAVAAALSLLVVRRR